MSRGQGKTNPIDYEAIHALRNQLPPATWKEIAERVGAGRTAHSLRGRYSEWLSQQHEASIGDEIKIDSPAGSTVDEALEAAGLDPEAWTVKQVWSSDAKATHHFVRVPNAVEVEARASVFAEAIEDMKLHAPAYDVAPTVRTLGGDDGEGMLFELAIHDPHFGMLSWPDETGVRQDLKTITQDYGEAVRHLLGYARLYNTDRILYVVGHDTGHVNSYLPGGKGAITRAGTGQDTDGRIAKIITTIRRAVVAGIDEARLLARPVDVQIVPGNHDHDMMYTLGEILSAWYRNDPLVNVIFNPRKRQFYNYGANAFMLCHGEEIMRKRDALPLIMLNQMPVEHLVASKGGCREIHTGHFHAKLQGGYYPTGEMKEEQGILVRALRGLTNTDGWHSEQGYSHQRAATALVYRHSGGNAGTHEFTL